MKRTIKKQFWVNQNEAADLRSKAQKACLTEAGLFRMLLAGYEPREKPDDRFYQVMQELGDIGNRIEHIANKMALVGASEGSELMSEAIRWHRFQADVEQHFLCPISEYQRWQ